MACVTRRVSTPAERPGEGGVGWSAGRKSRHFARTSFKPRKVPENAQTPTGRVVS